MDSAKQKLSNRLWVVDYEVSLNGRPYAKQGIAVIAISTDDAYQEALAELQERQQQGLIHSFGLPIGAHPAGQP